MGISLTGIHVYGSSAPERCGFSFHSYSENWFTCTDDFSDVSPGDAYNAARKISTTVSAPVLFYQIEDADTVFLAVFTNGKLAARYADDECITNKKARGIPAILGLGDSEGKQFSHILLCPDAERKTAMLEEFFGVCLLYLPEFRDCPELLFRRRGDTLYCQYREEEKALTGKAAPYRAVLTEEYPGKLFFHDFGAEKTKKEHCFLYGYASEDRLEDRPLTPVYFAGPCLEAADPKAFREGRTPLQNRDSRFQMEYGTKTAVTFSAECPDSYVGKRMTLPAGFRPIGFLPTGVLILEGKNRIFLTDDTLKIIAELSIKGEIADITGDYVLTVSGDSFCGYAYERGAKIRIYRITKQ